MSTLDARLLAAHAAGDHTALSTLYAEAAEGAQGEARAFYLTQALVYALEAGRPEACDLRRALVRMGRDSPA